MNIHKKELYLGLAITCFSILLTLSVMEVGLRIYQARTGSRTTLLWHDDALLGRRLNPSQTGLFVSDTHEYKTEITVNKDGFRDTEHSVDKQTFRILLIGDSFVENFQVPLENTISKQIEKQLTERLHKPVEVIAMGLGDTGTAQQYLLLKNIGLKYNPDIVVQLFFSGNDVKNNSKNLMGDPYRPYFNLQDSQLELEPFSVRSNNPVYKFISILKSHSRTVEFLLNIKGKISKKSTSFPIDYEVYRKSPNTQYQSAWAVTEKLIQETQHISESNGAKYILVTLANNEQVNNEVQQGLIHKYPQLGSSEFDFLTPDKHIAEICKDHNLSCGFMYNFFKSFIEEHHEITHFPLDGHFNEVGTNLAARYLTEAISTYLANK